MKKLVFTLALVGFSTVAIAQRNSPEEIAAMKNRKMEMQEKRAEKQSEHLAKMKADLNLNDAQVAKIQTMHAEMKSARQEEMKQRKEMKKQSAMKMKAKREMMNNEMKTILSPDQYKKWEAQKMANQDKRKAKMQERKGKIKNRKLQKRAGVNS